MSSRLDLQLFILKYFYQNESFESEVDLLRYYNNHGQLIDLSNWLNLNYLNEYIKEFRKQNRLMIDLSKLTFILEIEVSSCKYKEYFIYLEDMPNKNYYNINTIFYYLHELVMYYNIPHT